MTGVVHRLDLGLFEMARISQEDWFSLLIFARKATYLLLQKTGEDLLSVQLLALHIEEKLAIFLMINLYWCTAKSLLKRYLQAILAT